MPGINQNQVQGKVSISLPITGLLRSKPGASLDLGGVKRDPVVDDQGVAGYTEQPVSPSIDATFIKKAGVSAATLAAIVQEDISFEGDDGAHYVLRDAWCAEPPSELDAMTADDLYFWSRLSVSG